MELAGHRLEAGSEYWSALVVLRIEPMQMEVSWTA
jgi:hypothetical protein